MRIILDTNIILSGLISLSGRLIDAWLDHRFILVSHALQLAELREVSRREKIRKLIRPSEAGRLINQIFVVAEMSIALPNVERSPDPRDDLLALGNMQRQRSLLPRILRKYSAFGVSLAWQHRAIER